LLRQTAGLDQLHAEKRSAVLFADLVNLDDVRMLQACDRLGLSLEAPQLARPRMGPGQNHLERDEPIEPEVPGPVHDAHRAPAEFAEHFVSGDVRTGYSSPGLSEGLRRRREYVNDLSHLHRLVELELNPE